MSELDAHGPRVLAWLEPRRAEMRDLLTRFAEVESPSLDPTTIPPIWELIAGELRELDFTVRRVRGVDTADHLFARPSRSAAASARQLLLGHMDTVWPVNTIAEMPVATDDKRLRGPGTFDMKGGLVQMLFALRALRALDVPAPVTPLVFVNTDEEIGSPDSSRWVRVLARCCVRAFVMEGAFGLEGRLKTGRKGVGRFTIEVTGTAAHAGIDPERGVSAVLEVSHQIQRLFALNDTERGITVNVGTVDGGMRPNVVAPTASAEVDVRVRTAEDAHHVEAAIRSLTPVEDGVRIDVEGGFGRLPLEPTPRNVTLWNTAQGFSRDLGLDIDAAQVGGASDGNTTSQFTATLDGLGSVGDGAHAPHEYVELARMPERAALLAMLIAGPAEPASA